MASSPAEHVAHLAEQAGASAGDRDLLGAQRRKLTQQVLLRFVEPAQFERRPFESFRAYAQSKACDRMLTWALARRLEGSGVTANAMTPGLITETKLYRNAAPELIQRLTQYSGGRTSAQGADTAVWLASAPELEDVSGKFFEDREELPCEFRNKKAEEKLWRICEELVNMANS